MTAGRGILLFLSMEEQGVLLPLLPTSVTPSVWGVLRPRGPRGWDSLGLGGMGGLAGGPCLRSPGGEDTSLFMGGLCGRAEGVERPEEGRERSLLTGILLGPRGLLWESREEEREEEREG
jgi:hypothetical protein